MARAEDSVFASELSLLVAVAVVVDVVPNEVLLMRMMFSISLRMTIGLRYSTVNSIN